MELNYKIQTYDWGKKGQASKVAALFANVTPDFQVESNKPYSELWLGTHINGPSSLKDGTALSTFLAKNPQVLGAKVRSKFGDDLPFLFKVLSVNQALSIQAHPSKEHAEELHKTRPDIYKDPNHKPELAIALTPFEALCGFRKFSEIEFFIRNVPELTSILVDVLKNYPQKENSYDCVGLIKEAFRSVLISPKDLIERKLQQLILRLKNLSKEERDQQLAPLVEKLHEQYPGDVGCFVAYFLNYLNLKQFEAIYLGANVPHAYISGDCMESMACSDNVVRAGLTPKLIDVDTLCSMLIYEGHSPEENIFKPLTEDDVTVVYKPPVPDFAVAQIKIQAVKKAYEVNARPSASILIVIEGQGRSGEIELVPGKAIFLEADKSLQISDIGSDLLIYQSFANI